jgi:hypothetical protein
VDGDELAVARHVNIGFDESRAQLDGGVKGEHGVFGGMTGGATMSNDPRFPHRGLS